MSDRITHSDKPVHSSKQLHGAVNDQERLHSVQKQNGQKAEQTNKLVNAQVIPAIEIEGHDKASKKSAHAENKSAANHKAVQSAEHKGNGVQLMETISSGFQNVWNAGDRLIHTVEKRIGQQVDSAEKNLSNGMKAAGIPEPVKNAVSFGVHCTRMQIEDNYKMNKGLSKGVTRFVGETAGTLLHLEAEIVDELKSKETAEEVMEKFSNPAAMAKRLSTGVPYVPFIEEAVEHVAQNHLNEVTGAVGKLTDHYSKNGGWNKAFDDAGKATQNYLTHFAQADKEEQFEVIGKDVVPLILDGIAAVKVVSEVNAFVKGARGVKVAATVAEGEAVAEGAICKATGEASDLGGFAKGEKKTADAAASACDSVDDLAATKGADKIPGRRPYTGPESLEEKNRGMVELTEQLLDDVKPVAKQAEKIVTDKLHLLERAETSSAQKIQQLGLDEQFSKYSEFRFLEACKRNKQAGGAKNLDGLKTNLGEEYPHRLKEFIQTEKVRDLFIDEQIKSCRKEIESINAITSSLPEGAKKVSARLDELLKICRDELSVEAKAVLQRTKDSILSMSDQEWNSLSVFATRIKADSAYQVQHRLSSLMEGVPAPERFLQALEKDGVVTAVAEICQKEGRFAGLSLEEAKKAVVAEAYFFKAQSELALKGRPGISELAPNSFENVDGYKAGVNCEIPPGLIQKKISAVLQELFGEQLPADLAKFVQDSRGASAYRVFRSETGDRIMLLTAEPSNMKPGTFKTFVQCFDKSGAKQGPRIHFGMDPDAKPHGISNIKIENPHYTKQNGRDKVVAYSGELLEWQPAKGLETHITAALEMGWEKEAELLSDFRKMCQQLGFTSEEEFIAWLGKNTACDLP